MRQYDYLEYKFIKIMVFIHVRNVITITLF